MQIKEQTNRIEFDSDSEISMQLEETLNQIPILAIDEEIESIDVAKDKIFEGDLRSVPIIIILPILNSLNNLSILSLKISLPFRKSLSPLGPGKPKSLKYLTPNKSIILKEIYLNIKKLSPNL